MSKEQIIVFSSKDEILEEAHEQEKKVEKAFQHSTFLYFLARYFVSVFESRYGKIPVQVWNEYRNALDHFFRHLTSLSNQDDNSEDKVEGQLQKMEGHLQRAALDIMKIHCHRTKDSVTEIKKCYKPEALQLVDNGRFSTYLIQETNHAENLFETAKIYDAKLGETARIDKDVINKYLDAVFKFDALKLELINRADDIRVADNTYKSIHDNASKGSMRDHFKVHFIFYALWTLSGFVLGHFWDDRVKIYEGVKTTISDFVNSNSDEHDNLDKEEEAAIKGNGEK